MCCNKKSLNVIIVIKNRSDLEMVAKNTDKVEKLVESAKQFYQSIPSGAAKSGRVWKEKNSK